MTGNLGPRAQHIEPVWWEYMLWPAKTCPRCERSLPANTDFFGRDKSNEDKLARTCRDCRRVVCRKSYSRHRRVA